MLALYSVLLIGKHGYRRKHLSSSATWLGPGGQSVRPLSGPAFSTALWGLARPISVGVMFPV